VAAVIMAMIVVAMIVVAIIIIIIVMLVTDIERNGANAAEHAVADRVGKRIGSEGQKEVRGAKGVNDEWH
jgi:hypothetical protein